MNKSIEKLVLQAKNIEQFIATIIKFPGFYLRTDAERRMTKKDLRDYYVEKRGL